MCLSNSSNCIHLTRKLHTKGQFRPTLYIYPFTRFWKAVNLPQHRMLGYITLQPCVPYCDTQNDLSKYKYKAYGAWVTEWYANIKKNHLRYDHVTYCILKDDTMLPSLVSSVPHTPIASVTAFFSACIMYRVTRLVTWGTWQKRRRRWWR